MESPRLEVSSPDAPPQQVVLNDPALTIGRHRSNRLVIPDERASRFHCVVEQTPEGFRLRDLQSKNGTKLNNLRVTTAYLKVGDSFRIGKTVFVFVVPAGYSLPTPPHPPRIDPGPGRKSQRQGSRSGLRSGSRSGSRGGAVAAASSDSRSGTGIEAVAIAEAEKKEHDSGMIPMPAEASRGEDAANHAAGLSFALPPPAPASRPIAAFAASGPPASVALVPVAAPAPPAPPPSPAPLPTQMVAAPFPVSAAGVNAILEALRAFARFDRDSNPDAMLGESHMTPYNVGNPLNQTLAQLHPSDPASIPLRIFKEVALAAMRARGSHVLIEPRVSTLAVRTRVDGSLVDVTQMPRQVSEPLVAMLRVLTNLSSPAPGAPPAAQEGRFRLVLPDRPVDCQLALTPTVQGTAVSIRLSDPRAIPQKLPDLALPLPVTRMISDAVREPSGLVLMSGPVGSGVSATLYAALRQLDLRQMHVITIESQIDTPIDGVTQVPYDDASPHTLGPLIRVALKQSPSVLLVGDLPDRDAAQAVLQAAEQGYLVLAALRARDAASAVSRLRELSGSPAQVASNLRLVVAQRLIRLLCPHCKTTDQPTKEQSQRLTDVGSPGAVVYAAKGCPRCFNLGYMMRRPLAAAVTMNDQSRAAIESPTGTADLRQALTATTNVPIRRAADELVAHGLTSFDEADRATG